MTTCSGPTGDAAHRQQRCRSTHAILRGLLFLILCLLGCGVIVLAGTTPADRSGGERKKAQKPDKKKVTEEEEDDPKPKKRVEDEDDKPAKHKVVRPEEDDEKPTRPAYTHDLAKAAREARPPAVRELFASLAVPYDEVVLRAFAGVTVGGNKKLGGKVQVAPFPEYVTDVRNLKNRLNLKIIDKAGKVQKTETVGAGSILGIRYYEKIALEKVQEFLSEPYWKRDSGNPYYLPRFDQLLAAEQALSAIVRFHQSAREREVRKGDAWKVVGDELHKQLLGVLLLQLNELKENKAWDQAFDLTRRLAETYTDPKDHERLAKPLADLLKSALSDTSYSRDRLREARQRLRQLEDRFPNSDVIKPISDSLREQAEILFKQAQALVKDNRKADALPLLKQAEDTWPELPGLRALRIATYDSYQILRVNMREIPKYLSPGWAVTDSERRAVELLFESLVTLLPDDRGVMYYASGLGVARAKVIPLGREFKLPRQARWSDGVALTATDLRATVRLLQEGQGTGRCAAWGDLLQGVRVEGDPFRVKLLLRQGFIDPLAVMSFKVLPQRTRPEPASEEFALKPISSGPFMFGGRLSEDGREYTSFLASPYYGIRGSRLGLPHLKEVRIFAVADPVKDLKDPKGNLDLALDLTAEQAAELLKQDGIRVPLPTAKVPNRRIYFLAINHRKPNLKNADLRVALARAINREQLLDDHFRKGLERKVHRAINGPYPARSWACNPTLVSRSDKASLDPYDIDLARTKLKLALAKLGVGNVSLTLKYPSGDKVVAAAVSDLCEKVNKELKVVKLVAEEQTPYKLREDVEGTHSYDLAYYSYDFPDESFWLLPLLGPSGAGGSENYLGYNGALVGKIQSAMALRNFTQVREYAHAIHQQMLNSEMPFIPLWQLDQLYAYRKNRLLTPPLDPIRMFTQVETWRVRGE